MILVMSFFGLLANVIFYGSIRYFFWKFKSMATEYGVRPGGAFFQFITQQQDVMNHVFLVSSLGVLMAMILVGLLYSHRIAGPLYGIEKQLLESKEQVACRKGDYTLSLVSAINQALKRTKN